jgi:hypothetical protein
MPPSADLATNVLAGAGCQRLLPAAGSELSFRMTSPFWTATRFCPALRLSWPWPASLMMK